MESLQELAMDFMNKHGRNLYAADRNVKLKMNGSEIDVESIWYSDEQDKIFLHVGCKDFEGDIDIDSLSDENQKVLRKALKGEKEGPLLFESLVLLSADLYQTVYDSKEKHGYREAVGEIVALAKQFEEELDWQEDDERDYIEELEKFEKKVLEKLEKDHD